MSSPESSARKIAISVTSSLIATGIIGVLSIFSAPFRGWLVAVGSGVKAALLGAWHFLFSSHGVPGWLIGVAVVLAVPTLWRLFRRRPQRPREPTYFDYTRDSFEGMTWCWSYYGSEISGEPVPRCPVCQQVLVYRQETVLTGHYGREFGDVTVYRCENCRGDVARCEGTVRTVMARVVRSIDRKLHSGEWRQMVERQSTRTG